MQNPKTFAFKTFAFKALALTALNAFSAFSTLAQADYNSLADAKGADRKVAQQYINKDYDATADLSQAFIESLQGSMPKPSLVATYRYKFALSELPGTLQYMVIKAGEELASLQKTVTDDQSGKVFTKTDPHASPKVEKYEDIDFSNAYYGFLRDKETFDERVALLVSVNGRYIENPEKSFDLGQAYYGDLVKQYSEACKANNDYQADVNKVVDNFFAAVKNNNIDRSSLPRREVFVNIAEDMNLHQKILCQVAQAYTLFLADLHFSYQKAKAQAKAPAFTD